MLKKSNTQFGLLSFLENIFRSHPLLYIIVRYLCGKIGFFEADAEGLKNINFSKPIVCVDVGASDGVFAKYLIKNNIKLKKVYFFEPNENYKKDLKKLNKINAEIFDYGLGLRNEYIQMTVPYYYFFKRKLYLNTYAFSTVEDCKKQIDLDFKFRKKIFFDSIKIKISNNYKFNEKIDLIKIDINGSELEIIKVLESTIQEDNPLIYIENNFNLNLINKILSKYEYSPYFYDFDSGRLKPFNNESKILNIYFLNTNHKQNK